MENNCPTKEEKRGKSYLCDWAGLSYVVVVEVKEIH